MGREIESPIPRWIYIYVYWCCNDLILLSNRSWCLNRSTTILWVNDFMHASQIGFLFSCFVFCSVSFHWSRDRKQASWCSQSRGNFFFYLQLKNLQFDLIIDNTLVTAMWTLHNWLTCIIDYHSKEVQSENNNFFIILEIICRYTVVIFHELCHFNKYLPSFIPLILYFKICKWVAFKKCFKKTFL